MRKYIVTVVSNFNTTTFESTSRNAKALLRKSGGHTCIVRDKKGNAVCGAKKSEVAPYNCYNICIVGR